MDNNFGVEKRKKVAVINLFRLGRKFRVSITNFKHG